MFIYGLVVRPAAPGAVPQGWSISNHFDPLAPYGCISYEAELSPEQIRAFELIPALCSDSASHSEESVAAGFSRQPWWTCYTLMVQKHGKNVEQFLEASGNVGRAARFALRIQQ